MDDRTSARARFETRIALALEEAAGPVRPVDAELVTRRVAAAHAGRSVGWERRWTVPRWLGGAAIGGLAIAVLGTGALIQRPSDIASVVGLSPIASAVADSGAAWFLFEGAGPARANLYIARADGSDTRLVASDSDVTGARWSPDGAHVGYGSVQGGWTVVDIRDGSVRRVPMASPECGGPAWSADGTRIATFTDPCANLQRDTGQYVELSLERVDGTGRVRLARAPGTPFPEVWEGLGWDGARALEWSPDGSRIAFACRDDTDRTILGLCAADVDDAAISSGVFTPVRLETSDVVPTDWAWTEFAWSPDSQWLVAAPRSATVSRFEGIPGSIVVVPVGGGTPTVVATGGERSGPGRPRSPAWTPDGDSIVYYTYRDNYLPHGSSWIVGADGTGRRQLGIPVGWACPMAPSLDGQQVVAQGFYGDGTLFIGTLDDRPPHLYVSPGASDDGTGSACPAWQPRPVSVGDALPEASPAPVFGTSDPRTDIVPGM
jgi:Tol biopolymer transport system component